MRAVLRAADLRAWHAAGLTDRAVARRAGVSVQAVFQRRKALGLPPNRARRGDGGAGLRARQAGRVAADRAVGPRYGLPPDLRARQVAALVALAAGPRTAAGLLAATGRDPRRGYAGWQCPAVPGRNLLADLARRGLVARVPRYGGAAGQAAGLYLLTPAAMDMMSLGGRGDGDAG